MDRRGMDRLMEPETLAVVGASARAESVAGIVTGNVFHHFKGKAWPVNPNRKEVMGRACFARVEDLPETPDLAVIVSPADTVLAAVEACGRRGVKGAVIISDPHRGHGAAAHLRDAVRKVAHQFGMRIIGPNSLGLHAPHLGLFAALTRVTTRAGTIAFVGQSGTASGPLVEWADAQGLGFSHLTSLGDMVDVDYADVLFYLAEHRATRCIVVFAERLSLARRFLSAARHAARTKPVIIMKPGAASHDYLPDGVALDPLLPPRDSIYEGAFRRAGLLRVRTMEDLFDTVEAVSARRPTDNLAGRGPRLAILANGESLATIAMDALLESGGTPAQLTPATVKRLAEALPPTRITGNPVDILPDATSRNFTTALTIMMDDPQTDAILVVRGPTGNISGTEIAKAVVDAVAQERANPAKRSPWVLTSWPGGHNAHAARALFAEAHIPTFLTPSTAVAAFQTLLRHGHSQKALQEVPASIPGAFFMDPVTARGIIGEAQKCAKTRLEPSDAEGLLACYGLNVLNPKSPPDGVTSTLNWRIRAAVDPEFGPVLIFGLGGEVGRALNMPVVGLPPLNQVLAQDLILSHIAAARIFAGEDQSGDPAAFGELTLGLMRIAQMLTDLGDLIRIDLDPVVVTPDGLYCGDPLIEVSEKPAKASAARERLAIHPYPQELETRITARDGESYALRPIRPEDEPSLFDFFDALTQEDIRFRFFRPLKNIDHDFLTGLTQVDYDWHMAFVLTGPGLPGEAEVLGVVRLVRQPEGHSGEYAVIIRSDTKRRGLGRILMERIISYAEDIGFESIYGFVLPDNRPMLELCRSLGFAVERDDDDPTIYRVTLKF